MAVLLASALTPVAVLALPVVLFWRALAPMAVLPPPLVLLKSATSPTAVLKSALVLFWRALVPTAVLNSPVLLKSASAPTAVLLLPAVRAWRAKSPIAVLPPPLFVLRLLRAPVPSAVLALGYPPSGAGLTPKALGGDKMVRHVSSASKNAGSSMRLIEILDCVLKLFI